MIPNKKKTHFIYICVVQHFMTKQNFYCILKHSTFIKLLLPCYCDDKRYHKTSNEIALEVFEKSYKSSYNFNLTYRITTKFYSWVVFFSLMRSIHIILSFIIFYTKLNFHFPYITKHDEAFFIFTLIPSHIIMLCIMTDIFLHSYCHRDLSNN